MTSTYENRQLRIGILTAAVLVLIPLFLISCSRGENPRPPSIKKISHIENLNDDRRVDYYYWLKDRTNPDVIAYIREENSYADAVMGLSRDLQERLISEFSKRNILEGFNISYGNYNYYNRISEGKQYPVFLRKQKSLNSREEIILDQNELAARHAYYKIAAFEISNDQKLMAFCVDTAGSESYTIYIKDLQRNVILPDVISSVSSEFKWANDNQTLYYCTLDVQYRPNKVYRHKAGNVAAKDEFIYFEKDESFNLHLLKTSSGRFILIGASNNSSTEIHYLDAGNPQSRVQLFYPRQPNLQYYIDDDGKKFLVFSNDHAKNYKVDEVPLYSTSKNNWKSLIPHRNHVKIDEMFVFRNHLVIFAREMGNPRIEIVNLSSRVSRVIKFNEPVFVIRFDRNSDFSSNQLQVVYSSFITPPTVYTYNMDTGERIKSEQKRGIPGYDPAKYSTERIYAKASDGKSIPIIIVYKKGMLKNGNNPMLLTGYGAYNDPNEPRFSPEIISLLDRGVIYGIAQIRGGGEIDDNWYEQGKLLNKKNTFYDFIACSEFLINEKYTSREKLAIHGRSAGGLLIGAVVNMRPDLYRAAVPEVPFVDVINTMLDPTIFGTIEDYDEFGNPNYKVYYDYIKSYSPYDNVRNQSYPDMLIIGSMNDKRVSYWEPLKWTAKLREMKKGDSLLLLRLYENADHRGASGIYENYRMLAYKYAFILDRLGIQS